MLPIADLVANHTQNALWWRSASSVCNMYDFIIIIIDSCFLFQLIANNSNDDIELLFSIHCNDEISANNFSFYGCWFFFNCCEYHFIHILHRAHLPYLPVGLLDKISHTIHRSIVWNRFEQTSLIRYAKIFSAINIIFSRLVFICVWVCVARTQLLITLRASCCAS